MMTSIGVTIINDFLLTLLFEASETQQLNCCLVATAVNHTLGFNYSTDTANNYWDVTY